MRVIYWLAIFIVLLIIEIATYHDLVRRRSTDRILCRTCRFWVGSADRSICYSFHSASDSDKTDCGEVLQSGEAEDERRESDRTARTGDRRY